ncbi:MAG: T9SS type A sorting domain-containing protein, partial [Candidatus Marinimicrobia bacterium]|nr:T9SS type A sorting domain-containing protein [Candidatus Neomarinimicrobiota bacterium]
SDGLHNDHTDNPDLMYHVFCYSYNEVETSTETNTPVIFTLSQNYPNPFNPITTIQFAVPESQHVKLQIFDITGRLIETLINEFKEAGNWDVKWNAGNYSSGIYIYRLQYGDKHISRKMLLMK